MPASSSVGRGLVAVLAGNGVYFLLLYPVLPPAWKHLPFTLDRGLVLDFLLCLAFYGMLNWRRRV